MLSRMRIGMYSAALPCMRVSMDAAALHICVDMRAPISHAYQQQQHLNKHYLCISRPQKYNLKSSPKNSTYTQVYTVSSCHVLHMIS